MSRHSTSEGRNRLARLSRSSRISSVTDSYSLVVKKSAARELCALPKADLLRVTDRIRGLANTPRPSGHEKLPSRITIAFAKAIIGGSRDRRCSSDCHDCQDWSSSRGVSVGRLSGLVSSPASHRGFSCVFSACETHACLLSQSHTDLCPRSDCCRHI